MTPAAVQAFVDAMERMRELVYSTPFKPGNTPLSLVPNLEKVLFDYYYRGEYDAFWQQDCCDQERYFDRHGDIPSVFSGGWYDPFAGRYDALFRGDVETEPDAPAAADGPLEPRGYTRTGMFFCGRRGFRS